MPEGEERLREALIEVNTLRAREAAALRASTVLLTGMKRLSRAVSPAAALSDLLALVRESLDCDTALVLRHAAEGPPQVLEASEPALRGAALPERLAEGRKARAVPDLTRIAWWRGLPAPLDDARSLISAPLTLADGSEGQLVALSARPGAASADDRSLLSRLAELASQAFDRLALAERNATLAAVIEGASASVAIADATRAEMPLVYVNQAFVRLTGFSRDEILGTNCRFLSAEDPEAPERARLREAVASRAQGTFQLRNRARDGRIFWNRLSLYPVLDQDGAPRFMVATQVDITAERAAAEERDAARRRLVGALSATSEGFLLLDPDGRVVLANERYQDFFGGGGGFGAGPAVHWSEGADYADVLARLLEARGLGPQDAAAEARARRDALFDGGGAVREEQLPDGRIVLVSDRRTGDGGAVSIVTDITTVKATERLLAQRAAAIDAAQDGIAVTDADGRFLYINPSHVAMFGYEHAFDLLGRPWSVLYAEPEAEMIRTHAMPSVEANGTWRGEVAGRARDGSPVPQEVSLTRMPDIGLICVTRDISDRRRAEREREKLSDQLQAAQRQEAIGQLAAGVAHDFNNLLSAIMGSAELLEMELGTGHPAAENVERILAGAARASELVRRLMEIGRRPGRAERVDLARPFAEAVELLRAGLPGSLTLEVAAPPAAVEVEADATAFVQVALNLGINARDAMAGSPGRLSLALSEVRLAAPPEGLRIGTVEAGRPYARLTVADTGTGIDEDRIDGIFKPYVSTKGADGTGLGLSMVASILREADGGIAVRSTLGEGTTFEIYWPVSDPAGATESEAAPRVAVAPAASPPHAFLPGGETPLAGREVLVCDDDGPVAQVIAAILERAGAETAICEDPRDALEAVVEDPGAWHLLVTDYDMPQMTGADLATAVRQAAPELPILLCTALAEARRLRAPFDAALAKPVDAARLCEAAASLLGVPCGCGGEPPG